MKDVDDCFSEFLIVLHDEDQAARAHSPDYLRFP